MQVLMPPMQLLGEYRYKIFLAGSIELGVAKQWQQEAIDLLDELIPDSHKEDFLILNPRREEWNADWKQVYEDAQFYQQVTWELKSLKEADHVLVYFDPVTKAPISLLELGAFHAKAVVVCPDGYWRKGNVDIFCEAFNVKQVPDLRAAIVYIAAACLKEQASLHR